MQHPSLVSAYEFGRLPDGSAYIVMEYLEGETLRQRMKRLGRLGPDSVRIARQITSALAAAHAKHIVHRDLKPSNIMLVHDPDMVGGERIKVLDFGIAKLAGNQAPGQVETRTGAILGSPGYMSPEQCRNVSTVDERSDIYSLGVILYEMLSGVQPFEAPSDAETLAMHLYAEPRPLRELDPSIKPELAAFIHRMLRKQPAERPSTAEVLTFLNTQAGFASTASMPHPIIRTPVPPMSAGEAETLANTLSRASGQGRPTSGVRLSRTTVGIAAAALGVVLLAGFVLRAQLGERTHPTAAPVRTVRWVVKSTPSGAELRRESDGQILGRTPYVSEQPARPGSDVLLLRLDGYVDQRVTVERESSRDIELTLAKATPPPAPAAPDEKAAVRSKPPGGKAASIGKKRPGSSKVTNNADIELIK